MSLAVENLEHSMAKLTITVPAEEFGKAISRKVNSMYLVSERVMYHRHLLRRCMDLQYFMKRQLIH